MTFLAALQRQTRIHRKFAVQFLSIVVGAHGAFILADTLLAQVALRHSTRISDIVIDVPLLIGISLVYLSTLLRRRKRTAWLVTISAYTFYMGLSLSAILMNAGSHHFYGLQFVRVAVLPAVILSLLFALQNEFVVRSDIQGFRWAARFSLIILIVAFIYGVSGMMLLDQSDFHQEIGFTTATHYTLDRFDLTTNKPLHPYTKRAHVFLDSLSFVSIAAISYAAFSLFQPLRVRLSDQTASRKRLEDLLLAYGGNSEDYFKLWPHDKQYFFGEQTASGLAFHVHQGVALCVGDPAGNPHQFESLLNDFQNLCFGNDWLPGFVHIQETYRKLYEKHGFTLQKIGQEAVVDIPRFETDVATNKYFRHIRNKFTKQGFTCEMLSPPHHPAVVDRLKTISQDWLKEGGHDERGFVMGYYSDDYMQQCEVMVARDAAGTIQAFINKLPTDYDKEEATFDLLRQTTNGIGNVNDYLLMSFIKNMGEVGYTRLNLGLCPLTGLEETEDEKGTLIDSVLRFAYANGDRFYSFSGLHRFKSKYEPNWRDRFIAYEPGVRGFSRTTNSLMRSMRVKTKH